MGLFLEMRLREAKGGIHGQLEKSRELKKETG